MSDSTSSPPSGRDEGLRSPFRFPEDYDLTYLESFDVQIPTYMSESGFYAGTAAPIYAGLPNEGLPGIPGNMYDGFGGYGDFSIYQPSQAVGNFPEFNFNYAGDQQAPSNFSTNGELHFNNPALGLDQIFGLHYTSPSWDFHNLTPLAAPAQTFENTTPALALNDTTSTQTSQDTDWLLTEPVPGLEHYDGVGERAGSEGSSSPYTPESTSPTNTSPANTLSADSSSGADPETRRIFSNYEEVVNAKNRVAWKTPANDKSIPKTPAQMSAIVGSIIAAIRNNIGCLGQVTRSFVNRWSAGATFYKDEDIELVAWEVTMAMVDLHTKGWNKHIGDKSLREALEKTQDWTFEKRLAEVNDLLKLSKRTCEDLLKGVSVHSVIGVPDMLLKRTKSNESSNKRKGERIRRASDLEKLEDAAAGVTKKRVKRAREDEESDVPSVTLTKRAKTEVKGETKRTTKARKAHRGQC